ncbi:MAG: hypothetical protein M3464_21670 [Chloroflexota bacterium]|nr:hypothetical protein [Chloroflexota bacterium]
MYAQISHVVARLMAGLPKRPGTAPRICSGILAAFLSISPVPVIAQDAVSTPAAMVTAAEPDLASVMLLLLGIGGVDYSVPEADLRQWLGDREFTPYPAFADALLIVLDGKQLRQPVYLDVIVFKYEQAAGASSPRDISEVDFGLLRAAIVEAYNERYGETVGDFESLLQ